MAAGIAANRLIRYARSCTQATSSKHGDAFVASETGLPVMP